MATLIGIIPGLLGIALEHWPLTETWELTGLDLLFLLRGPQDTPPGVCVVAIDNASYDVLGVPAADPWPRRLHAELIRTLRREGARAIAFDILFRDAGEAAVDGDLLDAIRASGRVVLGAEIELTSDARRFREVQTNDPFPPFARASAAVATVGFPLDRDGVIRRAWLTDGDRPGLALAAYEVATADRSNRDRLARLIDYYGPPRTIRTVSFYQALEPDRYLPRGSFRDAIVFVGLSQSAAAGPAPKDAFLTPFRGAQVPPTYGVEIHATLAANLLEGRRLGTLPAGVEASLILLLPLVATLIFMYLGPVLGVGSLVVLELIPWTAGYVAFTIGHTWMPAVIPSLVQLPLAYVASLGWYYMTTVRERERVRRAFGHYLSSDMIERIAENPASLNLGGEVIDGTVLFTDLEGFTSLAESMRPEETAALLNAYFSRVNRCIFAEGGTLLKFIGDAVFAIWGAPIRMEDHATPACSVALELARLQGTRSDGAALSKLVTRIGVHTGFMLVGNLGSEQRFDYTAIGDAVNVASRVEGLNKYFGTRALATGVTIFLTQERFTVRRLGLVRVAGKNEPLEIFEILGRRGETTIPGPEAVGRFERALDDFVGRRFDQAANGFREVLAMCDGGDGPSELYLRASERFSKEPPPGDWDGTFVFESK